MAAVQGSALSKHGDVEEEAQVRRAIAASLADGGRATGSSAGGSASAGDMGLTACAALMRQYVELLQSIPGVSKNAPRAAALTVVQLLRHFPPGEAQRLLADAGPMFSLDQKQWHQHGPYAYLLGLLHPQYRKQQAW